MEFAYKPWCEKGELMGSRENYVKNRYYRSTNAWKEARKQLLDAGGVCSLCGFWVYGHQPDGSPFPKNSPEAPQIDHILPQSKGGSLTDLSNLQLVHARCNQRKGNRIFEVEVEVGPSPKARTHPVKRKRSWVE